MSQITKRALAESLKKLLLEKPLDRITVSDITEDCGVSRMTFYYHFKDCLLYTSSEPERVSFSSVRAFLSSAWNILLIGRNGENRTMNKAI